MTKLEIKLMNLFARCEMNQTNGAVPICADDVVTYTWAEELAAELGISKWGIGGIMHSLLEKGLIGCSTGEGDDNTVSFTDAGFAAWDAHPDADKS